MDPLSAVGLAAAVLQFVTFAGKICEKILHFHNDDYGEFSEGLFDEMTDDFTSFSAIFGNRSHTGLDQNASQNQKALDQLVGKCHDTAKELMGIFHSIASDGVVKDNNQYLVRRIAKVKLFFKRTEIDRLMAQLKDYRDQLVPCMLACLPSQLDAMGQEQNSRFDSIDHNNSQIVKVVAVVKEKMDLLHRQNEQLHRKMDHVHGTINTTSLLQHEKAMAAFLTFQNGTTKLLTRPDTSLDFSYKDTQGLLTMCDIGSGHTGMIEDFTPVRNTVLDSLYFRQYHERLDNVGTTHSKTYEWIFCPPEAGKPWLPFLEWLETGEGCYWINGKPGSGKSTLLKFIAQNERTQQSLQKWADGSLVYASFFFWNLGSPLQKSYIGLLRSLLHEILTQQPGLVSVVMPDLWRIAAKLRKGESLEEPSLVELKRWTKSALSSETTSLKFFFLIDGIDEFDGEHHEIVELINDIIENRNVKILMSSGPIPVCEQSFSHWPSLRLQDLTRGDIQQYATDNLLERLEQKDCPKWTSLINEITARSDGVFLWVILVVRSFARGLREGDKLHEMHKRLVELPSDLEKLYKHMIRNLQPDHTRQGSEFFQLLLKAHQVQSPSGFPLLLQIFFCEEPLDQVVSLPLGHMETKPYGKECDDTKRRIQSRTCGLIENRQFKTSRTNVDTGLPITLDSVDFIHRTVVEFLRLPDIWETLMDLTTDKKSVPPIKYDPSPQLFQSCVMMCKVLKAPRGIDPEYSIIWHMMDRAMIYASMAEDAGSPVPREHLKVLDTAMMSHWNSTMRCFSSLGSVKKDGHWAKVYAIDPLRQHVLNPDDFASIALFHGLEDYLSHEIKDQNALASMNTTQLLFSAVRYIGPPPWDTRTTEITGSLASETALYTDRKGLPRPRWTNIAKLLLETGANPNKLVDGNDSAWSLMIAYAAAACDPRIKEAVHRNIESGGFADLFAKLLGGFIKCGADLSFCASPDAVPARTVVSRLFSHEDGTLEEVDPWTEQPQVAFSARVMRLQVYFQKLMTSSGHDETNA